MSEATDSFVTALEERVRRIAAEVVAEQLRRGPEAAGSPHVVDDDVKKLRDALRLIMSKEFISVGEARLLLGCSDGHIRNLVNKARKGKTAYPIPFLGLDGVSVFPRVKLLEWAEKPKRKPRAAS